MGAGQKGVPLLYRHWHITLDLRRLDCASKQPKILSLEIALHCLFSTLFIFPFLFFFLFNLASVFGLSFNLASVDVDHFSFQFGLSFSGLVKEPSSLL